MRKRYSITLQTKLQELESALKEAFSLPTDSESRESSSEDIKQKILFIRKILSAEVASHPSKPRHLQHIAERLDKLQKDFLEWKGFKTISNDAFERDGSSCSCTESCFNDDAEPLVEPGFDGYPGKFSQRVDGGFVHEKPKVCFESFLAENAIVESEGGLLEEEEKKMRGVGFQRGEVKREERKESACGKFCCAMAIGIVIGMAVMSFLMVKFSGCFRDVEQTSMDIPT
ncbi:hypothetical protein L6164_017559 [Bauhinia variegata]|uniref:Uncharacterized protein n=1 Tax=Bauhinia variegata TaxID=167791 RepID=A0ACB9N8I0_BAUVA|nr:hypothetical protein L6164_017559 [Bauhinia variegata]